MHYVGSTAGLGLGCASTEGLLMDERVCALRRRASVPPAPEGGNGETAILPVPTMRAKNYFTPDEAYQFLR